MQTFGLVSVVRMARAGGSQLSGTQSPFQVIQFGGDAVRLEGDSDDSGGTHQDLIHRDGQGPGSGFGHGPGRRHAGFSGAGVGVSRIDDHGLQRPPALKQVPLGKHHGCGLDRIGGEHCRTPGGDGWSKAGPRPGPTA